MNRTFVNPFSELESLGRDVERLFGLPADSTTQAARSFFKQVGEAVAPFPQINVAELEDAFEVSAQIPGVDPAKLDLQVQSNELIIAGEKPASAQEEESRQVFMSERGAGKFRRKVQFTSEVNPEDVSAKYEFGILTIRLGKAPQAKPQSIKVDVVG